MNLSRSSEIVRCFSLNESVEDTNSGAFVGDLDDLDSNFQTYPTNDSDGSVAFALTDKIIDNIIQNDKYIYSVFDSIFNEKESEILIIFFPSIEEYVDDLTEFITSLADVQYAQWSKIKPDDSVEFELSADQEYFVILKIKLNMISKTELKPIKVAATKITVPKIKNKDVLNKKIGGILSFASTNAKKLIELQ